MNGALNFLHLRGKTRKGYRVPSGAENYNPIALWQSALSTQQSARGEDNLSLSSDEHQIPSRVDRHLAPDLAQGVCSPFSRHTQAIFAAHIRHPTVSASHPDSRGESLSRGILSRVVSLVAAVTGFRGSKRVLSGLRHAFSLASTCTALYMCRCSGTFLVYKFIRIPPGEGRLAGLVFAWTSVYTREPCDLFGFGLFRE